MEKKLPSNSPLMAVLVSLFLAVAGLGYYAYSLQEQLGQQQAQQAALHQEVELAYHKIDSLSHEVSQQIKQIQQLGGEIDELLALKKQLETDKYQLRIAKNMTEEKYAQLILKISDYEKTLFNKELDIAQLKAKNDSLLMQNQNQQQNISQLEKRISDLSKKAGNLNEKIEQVALLKIESLHVAALLKNGKEDTDREFKANKIEKLKIVYQIGQNPILEHTTQNLYLRIIEPDGATLLDMTEDNHKVVISRKEEFYTSYKQILFDNTPQNITQTFAKGNVFKMGMHKVELYHKEKLVAQSTFIIN